MNIVCNRCLLFKSDAPNGLLYNISNCGHVFCAKCLETYQGCSVCENPNVHFSAIDENMKTDMKLILAGKLTLLNYYLVAHSNF